MSAYSILNIVLIFLSMFPITLVNSIGCYKCSTISNDSFCIDPFNPGNTNVSLYEPNCQAGLPDRTGLFPAKFCLKVSGIRSGTGEQLVIRTCTVTKLLDSDSSHSSFTLKLFENEPDVHIVSGLIASCKDDGCNGSSLSAYFNRLFIFANLIVSFVVYFV